jgi:holo-[acyl-carrier protein] synthase
MRILGHGIDLVSVSRMRELLARQGDHFRKRIFSEQECAYCDKAKDPAVHFAARFAAKEAFAKASGLGLAATGVLSGGVAVNHHADGRPFLEFSESVAERFRLMGGKEHFLSITHDGDASMASVILVGE